MAETKEAIEVREPAEGGGIQVEVLPESPAEKPRLKNGDTRSLDVSDDEIAGYGREVQQRIKKLRFAFHEERRIREQTQRDLAATTDFSQRLFRENNELKRNVQRGERAVVHQAITRAEAETEQAKGKLKAALEAGNADDIVTAQAALARAVAEKDRLTLLQEPEEDKAAGAAPNGNAPQPPPRPAPIDEPTQRWLSKNAAWYQKPGHEGRTGVALAINNDLRLQGIDPSRQPDVYWKTLDQRLAQLYPDHAPLYGGNGNGNGAGDHEDAIDLAEPKTTSRPLAVAGGTRSDAGAPNAGRTRNVVQLTESQVRLARRLGLTAEQYARQVAIDEGMING